MKKSYIFTTTGQNYWHFHAIGVGVILNYHVKSMQVMTTCEFTGQLISVRDFYEEGGFDSQEDFEHTCQELYKEMIEDRASFALDFMDDPEIIESGDVFIAYDPKVIWN